MISLYVLWIYISEPQFGQSDLFFVLFSVCWIYFPLPGFVDKYLDHAS